MKITVYIPTHNYGRYIEKAIQSVISQTINDWELVIINDGSVDDTNEILKKYFNHPKVRIIEQVKKGLAVSNNIALRISNGNYIMRLDADDYLDENALLVLSNVLDTKPEIGLVYPDYYLSDEQGEVIEVVRRKKIGEDTKLLDLAPLGACTMFRKECLLELGGYAEEFDCQDGYELWLRFIQSFKPYNVNVPLFYYRQHPESLTKKQHKILETRRMIKRNFVERFKNNKIPKVLAIIPILKQAPSSPESAFATLAGKPLLDYTLQGALKTDMLDKIVVTSDDDEILEYSVQFKKVVTVKRPLELIAPAVGLELIVQHVLTYMKQKHSYCPEAVMILNVNNPLRRTMHIEKAIDTLTIFNVDTVISVAEELAYCYFHGRHGLTPIQKSRDIRIEKKAIYKETGSILLSRINTVTGRGFYGKKIGHIVMLPEESIKIKSAFDLWQAEKIIQEHNKSYDK